MFISGVCGRVTNSHQAVGAEDPSLDHAGWGFGKPEVMKEKKRVVEKIVESRTQNDCFFSKRMGSNSQNQMSFAFQMIREILRQIALNGLIFHGNHFVGCVLKYDQWKWEL